MPKLAFLLSLYRTQAPTLQTDLLRPFPHPGLVLRPSSLLEIEALKLEVRAPELGQAHLLVLSPYAPHDLSTLRLRYEVPLRAQDRSVPAVLNSPSYLPFQKHRHPTRQQQVQQKRLLLPLAVISEIRAVRPIRAQYQALWREYVSFSCYLQR